MIFYSLNNPNNKTQNPNPIRTKQIDPTSVPTTSHFLPQHPLPLIDMHASRPLFRHHHITSTPSPPHQKSLSPMTLTIRRSRRHSFIDYHRNQIPPNILSSRNLHLRTPSTIAEPSSVFDDIHTKSQHERLCISASSAHVHHANESTTNFNSIHPKKRPHLEIVFFSNVVLFSCTFQRHNNYQSS